MNERWEYRVIDITPQIAGRPGEKIETTLNEMGAEGCIEERLDFYGRPDSPPAAPRVPMERMNTPGSSVWRAMRTRSPRIAPPVNGLDGSTATTATVLPRSRKPRIIADTSVDLPAPGGPVTPITCAVPWCAAMALRIA